MGKGEFAKNTMKLVLRPFTNVYPTVRFACSRYAGKWLFGKNADFTVIPNAIELDKFRLILKRVNKHVKSSAFRMIRS